MLVNLEMTFATRVWVDPVPVPPTPVGTGDLAQLVPSRRVVDHRDQLDQGVALVVYPDAAEPWVLVVAHNPTAEFPGRLIVTPNSRELVVVEGGREGACFAVSLATGASTREFAATEFQEAHIFRRPDLLVLADIGQLWAYDGEGFRWESAALAADELEVLRREGDALLARGYVPWVGGSEVIEFAVDTATGTPTYPRPNGWV